MAPGSVQLIHMRVRGTRAATVPVYVMAEAADDGYINNNSTSVQLRVDNAVDLAVLLASGGTGLEDEEIGGQVSLRSGGRETASDGTLDIDLNAAGELLGASIHGGADCQRLTSQRARCLLPAMTRGMQLFVDYRAQFAEPGTYDVKFTLHAPGDTFSDNDTLTRSVLVRPYNDIAVAGDADLAGMLVGETREATFTVSTGRRALAAARFVAKHSLPGVRVVALSAGPGQCALDQDGGSCDFTALPANSQFEVHVGWRAESACEPEVAVSVSTPGDVLAANDRRSVQGEVLAPTDVELRVAQSTAGAAGETIDFPPIAVINGTEKARGTRLEVDLPPEVSLVSVSAANAICSGTAVLRCDFADLDANSTSTVNLSVRGSARGNFTSSLKVSSTNDTNPSNDSREVALQFSGAASSGTVAEAQTGAGSGGGGGGRFEWLALTLLGALVALIWGRRRMGSGPIS
jgi:hypothetical protein